MRRKTSISSLTSFRLTPLGERIESTASQVAGIDQPPPGRVRMAFVVTRGSNHGEVPCRQLEPARSTAATSLAIFATALMPRSGSVGCAVLPIAVIFQVEMPG